METTIAGQTLSVNAEGYLTDLNQWTPAVAEALASELNIALTPRHWDVIKWLQEQYKQGVALSIRKVGSSGVVDIKEFYQLFPQGPLKLSSRIAGIPKPASCI